MVFEPANKEFYKSTRAFALAAVELIIKNLKITPLSSIVPLTEIKPDEELFPKDHIVYPFTRAYAQNFGIAFHQLPEFNELMKIMKTDPAISKQIDTQIGTATTRIYLTAWDFIGNLLEKLLSKLPEKPEFDSEAFEKAYLNLELFFYSDNIPTKSIAPLHNFDCEIENLDLGRGLSIRKLRTDEQLALIKEQSSQFPRYDLLRLRFIVEFQFETKKLIGPLELTGLPTAEETTMPFEKINALVTALRLFKPGVVGTDLITTRYEIDLPMLGGMTLGYPNYGQFVGKEYRLIVSDVENFKRFWTEMDLIHTNEVALRRFNYSYGRINPEDKLIDEMIALEALFLEGEKAGGSSKTVIAVGCSSLLGKSREERRQIRKTLMEAYELRNSIVHGSHYCRTRKSKKNEPNIDILLELVSEVQNCVRESLKKLIT